MCLPTDIAIGLDLQCAQSQIAQLSSNASVGALPEHCQDAGGELPLEVVFHGGNAATRTKSEQP
jgi:hypothetical protein